MKFSCNQKALSKALNIVSKAVTARTTIPILKGILLKVEEDGKLTMSASDIELSIEKTLEVEQAEQGEIVVYAKLFSDIIRKLPNDMVTIETNQDKVNIHCASSEFNIIGLSADEFPAINMQEESSDLILFDQEVLKDMIRKTAFAASIDEARGVITGILMEMEEDSLNMVALDGFRMAIAREEMMNKEKKNIIIPARILGEISKIISETEMEENSQVKFYASDKREVFLIDDVKVVMRQLEGEYIKYRDILPKENQTKIVLNKNDFMESIERASLLAKVGKNNLIKLSIQEGNIEVTSESEEGNVKEEVMASKEGPDLIIGFNSKYLIDVLKVIDDEEIVMRFNTSISPCLVQPVSGNRFEYLILPVRITNN